MANFDSNYLLESDLGAGPLTFTVDQESDPVISLFDTVDWSSQGATANGDDPAQFEVGEYLGFGGGIPPYEYLGTVDINGETFIVTQELTSGSFAPTKYVLFGNVADPSTFDAGTSWDPAAINAIDVNPDTVCFAAGTLIATPDGETVVEDLAIGDLILTADGRAVPVKWVGRQTVHKLFTPAERFVPVRVRGGALGNNLPHTDLVLTADHALILDGLAINAGALVNGTTIAFEPIESLPDRVTYYHVETAAHDVILANGAPAETYVDYVHRRVFDNYREYVDLYGEDHIVQEMKIPRVSAARLVPPALRARFAGEDVA